MAVNDIQILKGHYGVEIFRTEANVKLGMAAGDLVKIAGTGTNYVDVILDGDPEQGTDLLVGLTREDAANVANTASADGKQVVELVGQGSVLQGKATTASNVNTDAKLLGLLFDYVACDRSAATAAGVLTIDEDEGTDTAVHGLVILNGDIVKGTLRVAVGPVAFWEGTV